MLNFIGTRLRRLPPAFQNCSRLLVTTWGHDPSEIPMTGALTMLLEALLHSPVLVQAVSKSQPGQGADDTRTKNVAFPLDDNDGNIFLLNCFCILLALELSFVCL